MKVVCHPADTGACGAYRVEWPARALADAGRPVSVLRDTPYRAQFQPSVFGDRIIGLDQSVSADVVVLQRPLHRHRFELIGALQAQGVAVVVEVDDDFHAIHPQNPAWKNTNPLRDNDMNRDWLMRSCAVADLVTVSTPALAKRYGAHGRVVVVRNRVPAHYCDLDGGAYADMYLTRPSKLALGWSGSVATHPTDLQAVGGITQEVLDGSDACFLAVGTGVRVKNALGLRDEPLATGWVPLEAYAEALSLLDVGMVPLALTDFNEAKSALKGLEMAALGVPFVASPTAEYRRLAQEGVGWVAESPAEWRDLLLQLVNDRAHREAMSEAWRETVKAEHTIEGTCGEWWHAWETARELADERLLSAA